MTFFVGWQREYQYFFVFASFFVIIFFTGHIRNFLEKRRVDRHLRQHGFLAETNPMTREENIVSMGRDQLFGINQLLYGHYTDGVHVVHSSFNNTPVSSLPGSRSNSRPPSRDGKQQVGGEPGPNSIAFRESYIQPPKAERKVESYSPEPGPGSWIKGDGSQRPPVKSYAARKYTPTMPSRLSLAVDSGDLGIIPSAFGREDDDSEKRGSESYSFRSVDGSDRSGSTRATSLEMPREDGMSNVRSGKDRVDLTSLSNHRMSHVAETGQFPRRKAVMGNPQAIERNRKAAYRALTTDSEDDEDGLALNRPRPSPGSPVFLYPLDRNPFDTPQASRPPSMMALDDITSTEEVQVPLLGLTAPTPKPNQTTNDIAEPEAAHSKRESQFEHKRDSDVYRRVNANFEVSRSGKKLDITEALELGAFNPNSTFDCDEENKRQSRKLQKKRVSRVATDHVEEASADKRRSSWFNFNHPARRSAGL